MQIYVARQPIIDQQKQLVGYELLFRDSLENAYPQVDAEEATSKLLAGSHLHLGIDAFTDSHPAFINFTKPSLLAQLPEILPKEQVFIELLEDIEPCAELTETCAKLAEQGYRIVLDDFAYKEAWRPMLPYVDIIKVDVLSSNQHQLLEIKKLQLEYPVKLLAEKVESYQEFERLKQMGFCYFQGYFFARPEIIQKRGISPSRLNLLQLMTKLASPDCTFDELEKIANQDLSLVYKLLRMINSSYFGFQKEMESVKQALIYLGEDRLKTFLMLLTAANLAKHKSQELVKLAVIRAKFSELIATEIAPEEASQAFLVGLFSVIDAILDEDLESILQKLPLAEDIKLALAVGVGSLAGYITLFSLYEHAQWERLNAFASQAGIGEGNLPGYYSEALSWCSAVLSKGEAPES